MIGRSQIISDSLPKIVEDTQCLYRTNFALYCNHMIPRKIKDHLVSLEFANF